MMLSTYTWDEASRLTSVSDVTNNGTQVNSKYEFVYDGMSRLRISRYYTRQSNGTLALQNEKRRVYDGMEIVQERDGSNVVTASLTRTGNIGGILARTTQAGSVFYGYDGSGNVTTLTDRSGAEVGSYNYDAFGNPLSQSGVAADANPYRFSTKESIAGMYSYGFRFYSPGSGRFINRDPIGENGGINLYGFVGNNPVNTVDFHGLVGAAVQVTVFGSDVTFSTPGYGHFGGDLLFDSGSARNFGSDVRKGGQITGDALNPLGDPYADAGAYSLCDPDVQISRALTFTGVGAGTAAGGLLLATGGGITLAGGSAARIVAGRLIQDPIVQGGLTNGSAALIGESVHVLSGGKGDIGAVGRAASAGALGGAVALPFTKAGPVQGAVGSILGAGAAGGADRAYSDWSARN